MAAITCCLCTHNTPKSLIATRGSNSHTAQRSTDEPTTSARVALPSYSQAVEPRSTRHCIERSRDVFGRSDKHMRQLMHNRRRALVSTTASTLGDSSRLTQSVQDPDALAKSEMPANSESERSFARAIGVDLGKRRTGVAMSLGGFSPRPLETLRGMRWPEMANRLVEIALRENAEEFVVGLPLNQKIVQRGQQQTSKEEPTQAKFSRNFARLLANEAAPHAIKVYLYDEGFTSNDASEWMSQNGMRGHEAQRGQKDAYAAAVLLYNYFERVSGEPQLVKGKAYKKKAPQTSKPKKDSGQLLDDLLG